MNDMGSVGSEFFSDSELDDNYVELETFVKGNVFFDSVNRIHKGTIVILKPESFIRHLQFSLQFSELSDLESSKIAEKIHLINTLDKKIDTFYTNLQKIVNRINEKVLKLWFYRTIFSAILDFLFIEEIKKPGDKRVVIASIIGFNDISDDNLIRLGDCIIKQLANQLGRFDLTMQEELYLMPGKLFRQAYLAPEDIEAHKNYVGKLPNPTQRWRLKQLIAAYESHPQISEEERIINDGKTLEDLKEYLLKTIKSQYIEVLLPVKFPDDKEFTFSEFEKALNDLADNFKINGFKLDKAKNGMVEEETRAWLRNFLLHLYKADDLEQLKKDIYKIALKDFPGTRRARIFIKALEYVEPIQIFEMYSPRGILYLPPFDNFLQSFLTYISINFMSFTTVLSKGLFGVPNTYINGLPEICDVQNGTFRTSSLKVVNPPAGYQECKAMKPLLTAIAQCSDYEALANIVLSQPRLLKNQKVAECFYEFFSKHLFIHTAQQQPQLLYDNEVEIQSELINLKSLLETEVADKRVRKAIRKQAIEIALQQLACTLPLSEPNLETYLVDIDIKIPISKEQKDFHNIFQTTIPKTIGSYKFK